VTEPVPDDRKYRNYVIAAAVGGVLLPIAGMAGAMVFWTRGDESAARTVALASVAGLIVYVIVFAVF
jgi:hypothetical protein